MVKIVGEVRHNRQIATSAMGFPRYACPGKPEGLEGSEG